MPAQTASPPLRFDVGGISDVGRKRTSNEDFWGCWEDATAVDAHLAHQFGLLYIVADGVGGNQDGEIASREATEQVMQRFYSPTYLAEHSPQQRLTSAIHEASRHLARRISELRNNMATTFVAALFIDNMVIIANVGDSRAYVIRATSPATQLTIDDVEHGNELTQAMGDLHLDVHIATCVFKTGDVIVLCTDGLHDLVNTREMTRMVRNGPAVIAARQLMKLANRRSGHDNITVLIVRNGPPPTRKHPYLYVAITTATLAVGTVLLASSWRSAEPVEVSRPQHEFLGISRSPTMTLLPTATLQPTFTPTPTPLPTATPVPPTIPPPTRVPPLPIATATLSPIDTPVPPVSTAIMTPTAVASIAPTAITTPTEVLGTPPTAVLTPTNMPDTLPDEQAPDEIPSPPVETIPADLAPTDEVTGDDVPPSNPDEIPSVSPTSDISSPEEPIPPPEMPTTEEALPTIGPTATPVL